MNTAQQSTLRLIRKAKKESLAYLASRPITEDPARMDPIFHILEEIRQIEKRLG